MKTQVLVDGRLVANLDFIDSKSKREVSSTTLLLEGYLDGGLQLVALNQLAFLISLIDEDQLYNYLVKYKSHIIHELARGRKLITPLRILEYYHSTDQWGLFKLLLSMFDVITIAGHKIVFEQLKHHDDYFQLRGVLVK